MFGIQTFFISKSITYLIRIFIYYNLDSQMLDGQVFLAFLGLNIIDWISLILTLSFSIFYLQMDKGLIKDFYDFLQSLFI